MVSPKDNLTNTLQNAVLAQMRLESLPNIYLLVQSDTTRALVRQLTCLLHSPHHSCFIRKFYTSAIINNKSFSVFTWHKQNTRATGCFFQLKPSLQVVQQLLGPLPMEQIVQSACTCNQANRFHLYILRSL